MFQNWGFLITEIFLLLLLAALLGLFCGWLIWGGKRKCKECEKREFSESISNRDADETETTTVAAASTGAVSANTDFDGDGVAEGKDEGVKPSTLDGPIGGKADDLKMIKGVGPKMEALLNRLGFYHFDQVANWSKEELAWVDANLDGFYGRATRDEWVAQAKVLAKGGETEFSKRVEGGDVY